MSSSIQNNKTMTKNNDFAYYNQLKRLINRTLLHLYFHIAYSKGIVPISKRNEILLKFLKPKLKDNRWSLVKKDIRVMIQTARTAKGNLESKMLELDTVANEAVINDSQKLYHLIEYLFTEKGVKVEFFEQGCPIVNESICYVLREHIEHCFNDDNQQIAPLSLLVQHSNHHDLINTINHSGLFRCEVEESNENASQAHLLLHPA